MMGFGFAGAAAGLGEGLISWADQRQQLADDLLKQKQRTEQVAALRQQERSWDLQDRAHKEGREDASRRRAANVYESLFGTESGGNFAAMNGEGYGGRSQFGQARLDDWSNATGAPRISVEEFRKNKDLQKDIEKWHFGDVKNFIQTNDLLTKYDGQTVGGVRVTESGMIAAAHLGGKNGLKRFLESGGKYDPADSNGTSISDYMRTHAGLSTEMDGVWDVLADPDVPAGMKERVADRVTGTDQTPSLTGSNWVDQGDGTEVLMGREGKSNRMAPYQGPDGTPITRKTDRGFSGGGELTRSDRLDLKSMYKSAFDDDAYDGFVKPNEAQFIAYVESSRRDGESLAEAADRAASEWTERDVTETTEVPRSPLSPMRLIGNDTYTKETTERVGGFGRPGTPAAPAAPEGAPETEAILQEARDAIALGASREAVIARLREQGIDPKGL